jgi:hypothetical protein
MINYISSRQTKIEEFATPFEMEIDCQNRWVKLSNLIDWDILVKGYVAKMNFTEGRPAVSPRVAIGALLVKHRLKLSDEETLRTVQENVYIQYFLGYNSYRAKLAFAPSLFVEIRKRMGLDEFNRFNDFLCSQVAEKEDGIKVNGEQPSNRGKLQLDATVCDQYIKYPTDLDLLNEARQFSEAIIDELYLKGSLTTKKPRTYRQVARKAWLNVSKKKNKTIKEIRKAIRQQLNYLQRNFKAINNQLDEFGGHVPLSRYLHKNYFVIQHVYRQQAKMYKEKTNQCEDRIVSIHQPHVRPIVRGKQNRKVEFGAKINVGLSNGMARIDRLDWNSYNEGCDLKTQVKAYKDIHGHYPELLQVDRIYANRENRKWLKDLGIRLTAEPLGRKPQKEKLSRKEKNKRKKEFNERNHIEGKFGQGKNGYNLNRIRTRLKSTSESTIACIFMIMNLVNLMT